MDSSRGAWPAPGSKGAHALTHRRGCLPYRAPASCRRGNVGCGATCCEWRLFGDGREKTGLRSRAMENAGAKAWLGFEFHSCFYTCCGFRIRIRIADNTSFSDCYCRSIIFIYYCSIRSKMKIVNPESLRASTWISIYLILLILWMPHWPRVSLYIYQYIYIYKRNLNLVMIDDVAGGSSYFCSSCLYIYIYYVDIV